MSQLLASDDDEVREAVAALAYYAADLQGPTEEAQALRGALEQLAADERASRRVREEAEAALRAPALERGRGAGGALLSRAERQEVRGRLGASLGPGS